jgi:CubicO group peptidase (beta-lactamase class C family)
MRDTDFYVPKEKRGRFATLYTMSDKSHVLEPTPPSGPSMNYDSEPTLPSGGGGLVSTLMDFYRFAQMLLNGGEMDGVRILAPQTVKLMMSNHLADGLMTEFNGGGAAFNRPRPGMGYGYNGAVVTDPGQADVPVGKGTYLWDGAAGTWFWIDPVNDIVFVGMVQRLCWFAYPCEAAQESVMGVPPYLQQLSMAATYQALIKPN